MQFLKVTLNNIGPYIGSNEFNFQVTDRKNIVLVGGKNGAGKTSLLLAIKIGMFGSFSIGLKSDTSNYQASLQKLLNYKELAKANSYFSISISFLIDEEFTQNEYTISRVWKKKRENNTIIEEVVVYRNGAKLSDFERENLFSKLKEIYPPSLIELSLFDGEKIGRIIESNETSEFIREVFYTNFGMTYFEKLDQDLVAYLVNTDKVKLLSNEELDLLELEGNVTSMRRELLKNNQILKQYELRRKEEQSKHREKLKKFSAFGGVSQEQKDEIQNFLRSYEITQKEATSEIRNFLEEEVSFFMNRRLITDIVHQIELEKPIKYQRYLNEISDFLGANEALSKLNDLVDQRKKNIEVFLDADFEEELIISQLYKKMSFEANTNYMIGKFSEYSFDLNKSKEYKNIIRKNEGNHELSALLKDILDSEQELRQLYSRIQELQNDQVTRSLQIEDAKVKIELLEKFIKQSANETNSFVVTHRIQKVINTFKDEFVKKKLDEISLACKDKFVSMTEKEDYITGIKINGNFEISLIDKNSSSMPIEILSAGEKQLLVSSLIYAIVKVSKRDTPFIFDTPLARLDFENRHNFVNEIMSSISQQTIILSTDSEIVGNVKQLIEDKISKKILLLYDNRGRTTVNNGYFGEGE